MDSEYLILYRLIAFLQELRAQGVANQGVEGVNPGVESSARSESMLKALGREAGVLHEGVDVIVLIVFGCGDNSLSEGRARGALLFCL